MVDKACDNNRAIEADGNSDIASLKYTSLET